MFRFVALVSASALCHVGLAGQIGVNVFGDEGSNEDSLLNAFDNAYKHGLTAFRVINVGAYADASWNALQRLASKYPSASFTLVLTSMFWEGPASCSDFPDWMDWSLQTYSSKITQFMNGAPNVRVLMQIDTTSPCPSSPFFNANPTESGMMKAEGVWSSFFRDGTYVSQHVAPADKSLPPSVDFIIPYQSSSASPDDVVGAVRKTLDGLESTRKFFLEGTTYSFWNAQGGSSADDTSFPSTEVSSKQTGALSLGFDGWVVSETGWPHSCPGGPQHRNPTQEHQCSYAQEVCSQFPAVGVELGFMWKVMNADTSDGCGTGWGLFSESGDAYCPSLDCSAGPMPPTPPPTPTPAPPSPTPAPGSSACVAKRSASSVDVSSSIDWACKYMDSQGDFTCGSGIPVSCQYPAADAYSTADFVFSTYYKLYANQGATCDFSGSAEYLPSDQWVDATCVSTAVLLV